jgi:hypothetical protein
VEELAALQPWQFALQRLSLSGVDTSHWVVNVLPWLEYLENE